MSVVIDEEGVPQTWTAVYWRYYSKYTHEAGSLEDALRFLQHGEDYGELSSDSVLGPDGEAILASNDEVWAAFRRLEEATVDGRDAVLRELEAGR